MKHLSRHVHKRKLLQFLEGNCKWCKVGPEDSSISPTALYAQHRHVAVRFQSRTLAGIALLSAWQVPADVSWPLQTSASL